MIQIEELEDLARKVAGDHESHKRARHHAEQAARDFLSAIAKRCCVTEPPHFIFRETTVWIDLIATCREMQKVATKDPAVIDAVIPILQSQVKLKRQA